MGIRLCLLVMAMAMMIQTARSIECFAPEWQKPESFSTPVATLKNATQFTDDHKELLLLRGGPWPYVELARELADDEDFGYSLEVTRLNDDSAMCCGLQGERDTYTGMVFINPEGVVHVMNKDSRYDRTRMTLEPRRRYHLAVSCCRDTGRVTVIIDGCGQYSCEVAFQPHLKTFRLCPQAPTGNRNAIAAFEFHRLPSRIVNYENGASGADIEMLLPSGKVEKTQKLTDGNVNASLPLPETVALTVNLPKRITISAVQLYGGNPDVAGYPSGGCDPKSYVVEGFSNGAWQTLCEVVDEQPVSACRGVRNEERFVNHRFTPMVVDLVRIRMLKSYDTGQRLTGAIRDDERAVHLRQIELFSTTRLERQLALTDLVQMEFRLPVHRNIESAMLTFVVAEHPQSPDSGELKLLLEDGREFLKRQVALSRGRFDVVLKDLQAVPAGRHWAIFTTKQGSIRRMFRVERIPQTAAPSEPRLMAGRKLMFTPDDYELSSRQNLSVEVFPVTAQAVAKTPDDRHLIVTGSDFFRTKDGKTCMVVRDHVFKVGMFADQQDTRILVADKPDGEYRQVAELPPVGSRCAPYKPFKTAAFPKPPAGTVFELYDKAKHGEIALGNLSYVYSYKAEDYGCVKAKPRTYWVTGRTATGKYVMMRSQPLFTDFNSYGEEDADNGFLTNDNFGGMWLAKDGKECYWSQGQTVKRSAPYALRYDNLQTGMRLMTVYSTRDGVDWQYRHCLAVPDEDDSDGAQHYGAMMLPMAQADLMLSVLYDYDGTAQQIYPELLYSHDGVQFHRFPGHRPLVRSTKPDDWYFGHLFVNGRWVQDGVDLYQLAGYCATFVHFAHEAMMMHGKLSEVTGEDFRRRFEERGLQQRWPYFATVGGWDGLAALTRQGYYTSGILKSRYDGWFGLQAGDSEGQFTTKRLCGGKAVFANAEIADNGYLKLELLDAQSHVLREVTVRGNDLKLPVFNDLPSDTDYRLRGTMRHGRLFCLQFE